VLISLVFLYFQLRQITEQVRQAERNQQASIRHTRASRGVDIQLARAAPSLSDAWLRGAWSPDEITQTQLMQFLCLCRGHFLHLEDAFYQHEEGLLNENAFATVDAGVRALAGAPGVRLAWARVRHTQAGPFRDFIDELVARARLEPSSYVYLVDEWRADFATEAASASR
jgi:hypothetical protein